MVTRKRPVSLGTALVNAIRASGLSQSELARRSGVSRVKLNRWLNDPGRTMNLRTASKLCVVLKLELSPMCDGDGV
jgi:transcriptional regulator with XRE-family HTH domain